MKPPRIIVHSNHTVLARDGRNIWYRKTGNNEFRNSVVDIMSACTFFDVPCNQAVHNFISGF